MSEMKQVIVLCEEELAIPIPNLQSINPCTLVGMIIICLLFLLL